MQCVERCDDPDPANHVAYEQPVWQSLNMFIGELGCTYQFTLRHPISTIEPFLLWQTLLTPARSQVSFPSSTRSPSPGGERPARSIFPTATATAITKQAKTHCSCRRRSRPG